MRLAAIDIGTNSLHMIVVRVRPDLSFEVTSGTGQSAELARSFKLGVIRLTERFVKSDPLSARDERRLIRHVDAELGNYLDEIAAAGFDRVIGTSGTILSLGSVTGAEL